METSPYSSRQNPDAELEITERARSLVAGHPHFVGRASRFQFSKEGDVLVVTGTVPSFYLKQMLQSVLKNLEGSCTINNQVQVIPQEGLFSRE